MIAVDVRCDMFWRILRVLGFKIATTVPSLGPHIQAPIPYGRHKTYYMLACRGDFAWASHSSGSLAVVGSHGTVSPVFAKNAVLVVRPEIYEAEVFGALMMRAARAAERPIVVKNVATQDVPGLKSAGLRTYKIWEEWSEGCQFDDQTFPDVVLDVSQYSAKSFSDAFQCVICPAETARCEAEALFQRWKAWYVHRHPKWNTVAFQEFYRMMFRQDVFCAADLCVVLRQGGDLKGFAIGSAVAVDQIDLWIALTDPQPGGLSREFFTRLRHAVAGVGFRYIGLGGSEEEGLHRFKLKLGPHILFHRTHMIAEPA
jgi:hypothetical protein